MKTLALAFALSLAVTGTPALAGGGDQRTVAVQTTDLNLRTEQGRSVLDHRLSAAIENVCRVHKSPGLPAWIRFRKCVEAKQIEIRPQRDAIIAQALAGPQVATR